MLTIHFFRGLPGSGKSTEAERMVRENPGACVRVNKDTLRAMLHAGQHSRGREDLVLKVRDQIIREALLDGKHVIVDDTNFDHRHRMAIDAIAAEMRTQKKCGIQVVDRFFDVPVEECIARDLKRHNSVGERVIRAMHRKHLGPPRMEIPPAEQDPDLPHAIIVDIDGTLARMKDRNAYEWDKVGQDELHADIARLINLIRCGSHSRTIHWIFCSGRDEVCRRQTVDWLSDHDLEWDALLMRPFGNTEKDTVIKERMYREHIEGNYYVEYVLDDRDQVVAMWRGLGLRCLQVAPGDF